jgi:hypothetical protein
MNIEPIIMSINTTALPLPEQRLQLEEALAWMIDNDFEKLVHALYRIDIDERQLKAVLFTYKELPAATLLADLIIERQRQKAAARQRHTTADIPPEEAW